VIPVTLLPIGFYQTLHSFIGADPDAVDADGISALGWACLRSRIPTMMLLMDRGATIGKIQIENITSSDGRYSR
jgi:ankyrin repeat protein